MYSIYGKSRWLDDLRWQFEGVERAKDGIRLLAAAGADPKATMFLMNTDCLTLAAGCNGVESIEALRQCFPKSFGFQFSLVAALVIGLEAETFEKMTSELDIEVNEHFRVSKQELFTW